MVFIGSLSLIVLPQRLSPYDMLLAVSAAEQVLLLGMHHVELLRSLVAEFELGPGREDERDNE